MNWALPIATLLIAGASLVASTFLSSRSLRKSASSDYVDQLEKRVSICESDRATLRLEVESLRREVAALRETEHRLLTRLIGTDP